MRTYDPIPLISVFIMQGQCEQCGNGATDQNVIDFPTLYQVDLVGTVHDSYGQQSAICRECYGRSQERTFNIFLNGGEDILCQDILTLEDAMSEILSYLEDPDEYGRYAPFRIEAQSEDGRTEHIATVDMPSADKQRSRELHYGKDA